MNNTQCPVRVKNRLSEPISIKNGARQRDALFCLLFSIASEMLLLTQEVLFCINLLEVLLYTDYIDFTGRTE